MAVASAGPYANKLHFTPDRVQITTPAPHHSVFLGRVLLLTPNQQCQSTEGWPDIRSAGSEYRRPPSSEYKSPSSSALTTTSTVSPSASASCISLCGPTLRQLDPSAGRSPTDCETVRTQLLIGPADDLYRQRMGADFSLFLLREARAKDELPPLTSPLPLSPLPLEVGPLNTARGL